MAMMGAGMGSGETRAVDAATSAISSPLLEDVSIGGARGVLVNITASTDFGIQEMNDAVDLVQDQAHEDANIIVGLVHDTSLEDEVRITVIATGFGENLHDRKAQPEQAAVQQGEAAVAAALGAEKAVERPRPRPLMDDSVPAQGVADTPSNEREAVAGRSGENEEFTFEDVAGDEDDRAIDIPAYLRKRWKDRRTRTLR